MCLAPSKVISWKTGIRKGKIIEECAKKRKKINKSETGIIKEIIFLSLFHFISIIRKIPVMNKHQLNRRRIL